MAKNQVFDDGEQISAVTTQPASPVSGDPVLVGQLPGVALTTKDTVTNLTTVKTNGVYSLNVKGEDSAGANIAVNVGDIILYDAAAAVKLNKDTTNGVRFGYALGALASGATGIIPVKIGY